MRYSHDDVQVFHDNFKNTAILQKVRVFPYDGCSMRKISYRLIVKSDYDDGFVYFVSVYETKEEALETLGNLSQGTFREYIMSDEMSERYHEIMHKFEVEFYGLR